MEKKRLKRSKFLPKTKGSLVVVVVLVEADVVVVVVVLVEANVVVVVVVAVEEGRDAETKDGGCSQLYLLQGYLAFNSKTVKKIKNVLAFYKLHLIIFTEWTKLNIKPRIKDERLVIGSGHNRKL